MDYILATTAEQAGQILRRCLDDTKGLGYDTETTGVEVTKETPVQRGTVVCFSIAGEDWKACIDGQFFGMFKPWLEDDSKRKYVANAKFEQHIAANHHIILRGLYLDTVLASFTLFPNLFGHSVEAAGKREFGESKRPFLSVVPDADTVRAWVMEREEFALYSADDAMWERKLGMRLEARLKETEWRANLPLWNYYAHYQAPFNDVLFEMERHGILVDAEFVRATKKRALQVLGVAETEAVRGLGFVPKHLDKFLGSNVELIKELYERRKFPVLATKGRSCLQCKRTIDKTERACAKHPHAGTVRTPSTESSALEMLYKARKDPLLIAIIKWRKVRKKIEECDKLIAAINPFTGRVHTSYSQNTARTSRVASSNPNCFSGDTQVLTRNGWLRFDKLTNDQDVMQWDPVTGLSFVAPTAHVKVDVAEMLHISSEHIDLMVTEDHRCPVLTRLNRLRVVPASEYPSDHKQLHGSTFCWPGANAISPELMRVLVAVQADGNVNSSGGIALTFRKARKIERMVALLNAAGITFKSAPHIASGREVTKFYIGANQTTEILRWLGGPRKLFGPWLLSSSAEAAKAFVDEIFLWDGNFKARNTYASKEEVNADWVVTMLALHGLRTHKMTVIPNETAWGKLPSYQVNVSRRDYSWTTNVKTARVRSADGHAYCVEVPSSFLIVRRNKSVMISGNCANISNFEKEESQARFLGFEAFHMREAFYADAENGYNFLDLDYSQLEPRTMAHLTGEPVLVEGFRAGADMYSITAKALFNLDCDVKDVKKLHPDLRSKSKVVDLLQNYGGGKTKLAASLNIPLVEAEDILEARRKAMPALYAWADEQKRLGRERGYVANILAWRRPIPEIQMMGDDEETKSKRMKAERVTLNHPNQSSAAEIMKVVQLKLLGPREWKSELSEKFRGLGAKMLLQIYDELLIETPQDNSREIAELVKHTMEHPFPRELKVPLIAEWGLGTNWMESKS